MRRLTGDHDGLGVPSQAVLEEPGEDRVSVRDEQRPLLQVSVHRVLTLVRYTHTHAHISINVSRVDSRRWLPLDQPSATT